MKRVVRTQIARRDLKQIWHYIAAAHSPDAADRLLEKVDELCEQLSLHPGMGELFRKARRDVRRFPLGNYVIYYEPIATGIRVLRVLHAAREHEKEV